MDLSIQPQSTVCFVTQAPFVEGARVVSFLLRSAQSGEIVRRDVLETAAGDFVAEGPLMCRWVRAYKPRKANENPERELKLTAENLFMTLIDPATELTPDMERLVMFLALMLERKRVLRPKGRNAGGSKNIYEHAKTKQLIEVPGGELTPEFFVQVQEQLSVLVGGPSTSKEPAPAVEPSQAEVPQTAQESAPVEQELAATEGDAEFQPQVQSEERRPTPEQQSEQSEEMESSTQLESEDGAAKAAEESTGEDDVLSIPDMSPEGADDSREEDERQP